MAILQNMYYACKSKILIIFYPKIYIAIENYSFPEITLKIPYSKLKSFLSKQKNLINFNAFGI